MLRKSTIAAALAAIAIGALATGCTDTASTSQAAPASADAVRSEQNVPASLRVPPGNHLVTTLRVLDGVQVYTCANGAWTGTEPAANMGAGDRPTVLYTAGPEWVSTVDGSAVWGKPIASADRAGTIPALLVSAVKNRGTGLFSQVDYIQRLDTAGGVAPAGGCTNGSITASPYLATEKFWAPGQAG